MKRPMTLVAGILGTVFHAIYTLFTLLGISVLIAALGVASDAGYTDSAAGLGIMFAIFTIIGLALSVTALVLSACSIGCFKADAAKYRKKRGLIITAIVFNALVGIFGLINFSIWNIFVFLAMVAAIVLYIVDLCLEKKRVAKAEAAVAPVQE